MIKFKPVLWMIVMSLASPVSYAAFKGDECTEKYLDHFGEELKPYSPTYHKYQELRDLWSRDSDSAPGAGKVFILSSLPSTFFSLAFRGVADVIRSPLTLYEGVLYGVQNYRYGSTLSLLSTLKEISHSEKGKESEPYQLLAADDARMKPITDALGIDEDKVDTAIDILLDHYKNGTIFCGSGDEVEYRTLDEVLVRLAGEQSPSFRLWIPGHESENDRETVEK